MKKIVILFSGEGTNLLNLIEKLEGKVEIAAAMTNNPLAGGLEKAKRNGLKTQIIDHRDYETREAFDAVLLECINNYSPDLVVMAGFMRILTPYFTKRVRAINLHPSLLPKFKGARAIERCFESEEKDAGVSVHWVSGELDGGSVIAQAQFKRVAGETYGQFLEKIRVIEYDLLPKTVQEILKNSTI